MATHYDIVRLTEVESTQDEASRRFDTTGVPTLVVADRQRTGRGRQGRTWAQADQALFSSLSFDIAWNHEHRTLVPLITGVVLSDAMFAVSGRHPSLKWPNDVLIGAEKVAGILVELTGDRMTVGCGVNLWWSNPVEGATSLFDQEVSSDVVDDLAQRWSSQLLAELTRPSGDWCKERYLERSVTIGHAVAWEEGAGTATGLTDSGALIVSTDHGDVTLHAGEVHMHAPR